MPDFLSILGCEKTLEEIKVLQTLQNLWVKRQAQTPISLKMAEGYESRTHQGPRRATPQPF